MARPFQKRMPSAPAKITGPERHAYLSNRVAQSVGWLDVSLTCLQYGNASRKKGKPARKQTGTTLKCPKIKVCSSFTRDREKARRLARWARRFAPWARDCACSWYSSSRDPGITG